MKTFTLSYTISERDSWRNKEGLQIKSNLADDKMIECDIAKSLVDHLKSESVLLEPDKLILTIAEAQKRAIQTSLENMEDMAIQAKVHADKAHEILSTIAEEAEKKYEAIEKKFSDTEKRFNAKMLITANSIKTHLEKLSIVEEKLAKLDNWKLEKLGESLKQIVKLVESDPELVKLAFEVKAK